MDGARRSGCGMAGPGEWRRTGEFSGIGGCRKIGGNEVATPFVNSANSVETFPRIGAMFRRQLATTANLLAGKNYAKLNRD